MVPKAIPSPRFVNLLIGFGLLLLLAMFVLVNRFENLSLSTDSLRTPSVPVAMLDNGKVGTILKQQGLVFIEDNDQSRYEKRSKENLDESIGFQHPFQRKRKVGDYLYRANKPGKKELPSTRQVRPGEIPVGQYLLSVAVTDHSLRDAAEGLLSNVEDVSRRTEKPATFSLFNGDKIRAAGSAGIRLYGSRFQRAAAEGADNQQYELFLRRSWGDSELAVDTLFDSSAGIPGRELSGLVVERGDWLAQDIALSLGELAGLPVPLHRAALFQLNDGTPSMTLIREQVSERQWWRATGAATRADLDFYHSDDDETDSSWHWRREMEAWLDGVSDEMTVKTAKTYIDVENLTDSLVVMMFCGSSDWSDWAIYRERNRYPYWRWIAWDLETCFSDRWRTSAATLSEQDWIEVVVTKDPITGLHRNTYNDIRARLFATLMNNDPLYRKYFSARMRLFLDKVAVSAVIGEKLEAYGKMTPRPESASLPKDQRISLSEITDFLAQRPGFILAGLETCCDP